MISFKKYIPLFCLPFLFSCGNGEQGREAALSNDSTPADIRAINEKINEDRNNPDLYFARAKAYF